MIAIVNRINNRTQVNRLKRKVYLMDATIIPLCLRVFEWAKFHSAKGSVKLHTILDYDGCMPSFVHITAGKQHKSKIAKTISFSKGCVVVVDRGYVDYAWMNVLDSNQSFFVTRSKSNLKYTVVRTFQSEALKESGVLQDQIIEFDKDAKKHNLGKKMCLVRFGTA